MLSGAALLRVSLLPPPTGTDAPTQVTNVHIYTKTYATDTDSCKVATKWHVSFLQGECKPLAGLHSSKNVPWQAWTSALDGFHMYYYMAADLSCFNDTEGVYNESEVQPSVLQYYDDNCTEETGVVLTQQEDVCSGWLNSSNEKSTQFERLRLDCGGAVRRFGFGRLLLAWVLWMAAGAVSP
mmetsp:Transcript_132331/g.382560  ORF Transcript_132331/g.382560 Transcript_132331/m.382560 type:complete len:182 (+) Transcript_132331:117-662(+)